MTRLFELTSENPANVGNSGRLLQPGIKGINMKRTQTLGAALVLATMITGCGSSSGVSTGAALSGEVVGGGAHNPISGAAITLYAMGSSGYGVGNTSLGTERPRTVRVRGRSTIAVCRAILGCRPTLPRLAGMPAAERTAPSA